MKITGKITLLALGAAIVGSVATTFAINAISSNQKDATANTDGLQSTNGRLYTVANSTPSMPSDFTHGDRRKENRPKYILFENFST